MTKVLILTVDAWNTDIGATSAYTYSTLFSSMETMELSNIYLREELPNDPCCRRYFQISEQRILRSLLHRHRPTGQEVFLTSEQADECSERMTAKKALYGKQKKHFYYAKKMIRELIWWIAPWKSKELDRFLEEIRPDVVVYAMEGYLHFNRLCRYVVQKTKASSIGYFWDDNFTYRQRPHNAGYKMFRFFQRKSLIRLAKNTSAFWAISPKTKEEADRFFGIDCEVLPKPTERELNGGASEGRSHSLPLRLFYAGNLAIGRMDSIRMVAEVLREINAEAEKLVFDVYSPTPIPEDLRSFGFGVRFHSPLPQAEILQLQNDADVLLFVEDVVGSERKVARLSFSTKIPDYLGAGKCILAIGDFDTAPMAYFLSEEIALCAQTRAQVKAQLETLLNDTSLLDDYGTKAYACACKNHSKKTIQQKIEATIARLM